MTHERAYSLRWLHVVGPATVFVVLYGCYLGPIFGYASDHHVITFIDEWISGIVDYWRDSYGLRRLFMPREPWNILGIDVRGMQYLGWGWMFAFSLAVGSVSLLLRSIRDKTLLPAHRRLGLPETVVFAMAWGTLAIAVLCIGLTYTDQYSTFALMLVDRHVSYRHHPPVELIILPFMMVFVTVSAISWIILLYLEKRTSQFWRLEKVTFLILIVSMAILTWTTVLRAEFFIKVSEMEGIDNAEFLALMVLFWAWTCRVILLFNFARFKRESLLNPDSSCFACGYDLRESRHQPSCPECGAAIPVLNTLPSSHGPDH